MRVCHNYPNGVSLSNICPDFFHGRYNQVKITCSDFAVDWNELGTGVLRS